MTEAKLTERQRQVYDFIREKIVHRGYGPTVREIGQQFAIRSPNGVVCHLRALERKGLIRRQPNKSRAIELLLDGGARAHRHGLPLAGTVAAGAAMLAEEQEERIDFGEMFGNRDLYVLQVRGNSMIEAQISDGDYVVVRKTETASPGDMVVTLIGDEATLKYWFPEPENSRIRLQPANSEMEPIYVSDARVIGRVVGVVRQLG